MTPRTWTPALSGVPREIVRLSGLLPPIPKLSPLPPVTSVSPVEVRAMCRKTSAPELSTRAVHRPAGTVRPVKPAGMPGKTPIPINPSESSRALLRL